MTVHRCALLALFVYGCASTPTTPQGTVADATPTVRNCGAYQSLRAEPCSPERAEAQRCMLDAWSRCEPAELRASGEGDDSFFRRRVAIERASDGTCIVRVESADGQVAEQADTWPTQRLRCDQLTSFDNAAGCQTLSPEACGDAS